MTKYSKYIAFVILLPVLIWSCKKKDYSMGALIAPTDVTITTNIIGQDATHPYGDGSGDVEITLSGKNVLTYHIDYNAADGISYDNLPSGKITRKFTKIGTNTYRITVEAFGPGATPTVVTKDIQVKFVYEPDPQIVTDLIGTGSKTWRVNKDIPGHFGVGPWSATSAVPEWWSAGVNEKVACCNCFYTTTFTFSKDNSTGDYTLTVTSPDGAFTKTGALSNGLPGVPASGDEGCYGGYGGGNSSFSFIPSGSGISADAPSTKVAIVLSGNNTYIGYGAVQKEYEILSISENELYLRVQGTETGNAWYIKLKAEP
jgi:hypothetical protein